MSRSKLKFWDMQHPDPKLSLLIELRGRLRRRHLPKERWQRDCIRIVIDKLRRVRKMEAEFQADKKRNNDF
jgi:hypothetical protein